MTELLFRGLTTEIYARIIGAICGSIVGLLLSVRGILFSRKTIAPASQKAASEPAVVALSVQKRKTKLQADMFKTPQLTGVIV